LIKTEYNSAIDLLKQEFQRITGIELLDGNMTNMVGKTSALLYMNSENEYKLTGNIELPNDYVKLVSSDSLKFILPIQYSTNFQNQIRIIKFTFFFKRDVIEYDNLKQVKPAEVTINGNS